MAGRREQGVEDGRRRQALRLVRDASRRLVVAGRHLSASIRFAAGVGAEPDDIAAASGLSAEVVRRIVDRR